MGAFGCSRQVRGTTFGLSGQLFVLSVQVVMVLGASTLSGSTDALKRQLKVGSPALFGKIVSMGSLQPHFGQHQEPPMVTQD